jgi:hypothetical protein
MAEFVSLFDGATLAGWHAVPRLPMPAGPGQPAPDPQSDAYRRAAATSGRWSVENGAIVGRQDPPGSGLGGYLLSDAVYGDFELVFEARPDWPADTGVLVRATAVGSQGYQILIDHRRSGNIGGFYGNGIGRFHAIAYNVDAVYDGDGRPVGLRIEDPATSLEPITPNKPALLEQAASGEDFLSAWKWDDWNEFHIRVAGAAPHLSVRINGRPIAALDTATMVHPGYDRQAVLDLLGRKGHIAFEVHDNDPRMGEARWGRNAACRWRRIRLREL